MGYDEYEMNFGPTERGGRKLADVDVINDLVTPRCGHSGETDDNGAADRPELDGYNVLSVLGGGGMGIVYKCFDKVSEVEVAVKALPPRLSLETAEIARLKENFKIVNELRHPGIAGYRTLVEDSAGRCYLVMDYVAGVDLAHWIHANGKEASLGQKLAILRQIAEALDYAHKAEPKSVIHRDIKPENVMIDATDRVRILDFGLAEWLPVDAGSRREALSLNCGTVAYKSPEQWLGQPQDGRSDQYSLGVLAYQMFFGWLPFAAKDEDELGRAVMFDRVKAVNTASKGVNDAFAKVLEKKPQDRFGTCVEFVNALERASCGLTRRWLIASGIGVAVLTCICSVWYGTDGLRNGDVAAQALEMARKSEQANEKNAKSGFAAIPELSVKSRELEASYLAGRDLVEKDRFESAIVCFEKVRKNWEWLSSNAVEMAVVAFENKDWTRGVALTRWIEREDRRLQLYYGYCFSHGYGTLKSNAVEAVIWYRRAAEQGDDEAQKFLGLAYAKGCGVQKDETEAVKWYRKSAEQGCSAAQLLLAVSCQHGFGSPKNELEALKWYRKAAEGGIAQAQCEMGQRYAQGRGLATNYVEAAMWYGKAAKQGVSAAQYHLGVQYLRGQGVARNQEEGMRLIRMAAEKGFADAQCKLADSYVYGLNGVAKDERESLRWYRRAAGSRNVYAACRLGVAYYCGNGVVKNYAEARKWLSQAAYAGNASAQFYLGMIYEYGNGVQKNKDEAIKWYRKAARGGNETAQKTLTKEKISW